ncbi:MAG TPA: hypothetical protein PK890_03210 [Terrimesophilobacter sp.]|nr:hypothetical protein [Terrimesophilobacter sp.]
MTRDQQRAVVTGDEGRDGLIRVAELRVIHRGLLVRGDDRVGPSAARHEA